MLEIRRSTAKVFVSFLINISAAWFIGAFIARNVYILIVDLLATTMSLVLAVILERYLENAKH